MLTKALLFLSVVAGPALYCINDEVASATDSMLYKVVEFATGKSREEIKLEGLVKKTKRLTKDKQEADSEIVELNREASKNEAELKKVKREVSELDTQIELMSRLLATTENVFLVAGVAATRSDVVQDLEASRQALERAFARQAELEKHLPEQADNARAAKRAAELAQKQLDTSRAELEAMRYTVRFRAIMRNLADIRVEIGEFKSDDETNSDERVTRHNWKAAVEEERDIGS